MRTFFKLDSICIYAYLSGWLCGGKYAYRSRFADIGGLDCLSGCRYICVGVSVSAGQFYLQPLDNVNT